MDATTNIESRLPNRRLAKGLELSLRRTQNHASPNILEIFKKTPCVAGLKPAGRDVAKDLLDIGIIPLPMKILLDRGTVHGDGFTVTGRKIAENLKTVTRKPHQNVQRSFDRPITVTGGVVGLRGNLAPADDRRLAVGTDNAIINVDLTDKYLSAHPSKTGVCATNHASGALWNDVQQAGAAESSVVMHAGGAHENQCYADV